MKRREKWQTAKPDDRDTLQSFLMNRRAPVPAEKLRFHGVEPRSRHRYYLLQEADRIVSAVYGGPGGFFYPLGISTVAVPSLRSLRSAFGPFTQARTIMGDADDVASLDSIFKLHPSHSIPYKRMHLHRDGFPSPDPFPVPGIEMFHPTASQWKELLPLQMAYEREEVLLPGNTVNPQVSRSILIESLTHQIVIAARYRGEIVGRAGTNAIGYGCAQIGGVYTEPRLRKRGIARRLMAALLSELRSLSMDAVLFVKPHNDGAIALYQKTGFVVESDFQINYY